MTVKTSKGNIVASEDMLVLLTGALLSSSRAGDVDLGNELYEELDKKGVYKNE